MVSALIWSVMWVAALGVGRKRIRQTTLGPSWWWELASVLVLAAVAILLDQGRMSAAAASQLQYVAGVTTLCPLMATLGAKRPQDRAWQFVVLALLSVLILPAIEASIYHPRRPLQISSVWQGFVGLLVLIGPLNRLGTRFWLAGLLLMAGQACLLQCHLPVASAWPSPGPAFACGLGLGCSAAWLRALDLPRRSGEPRGWSRAWVDFRDLFGTVWGLRIMERFNSSAKVCGWKPRLHWGGLESDDSSRPAHSPVAEQGLATLLRRFVSDEWISERLGPNE